MQPVEPLLPVHVNIIVIALADEGVPIAAIARSVKHPSDEVRDALREAIYAGQIVEMPRDDWPPHVRRTDRVPSTGAALSDEQVIAACRRMFRLTKLEATVLFPLLKRDEASKVLLHQAIEAGRSGHADADETDPKMVDVVICKTRKKLKEHGIEIKTMWAKGYFIERAQRRLVYEKLAAYLGGQPIPAATEKVDGEEPAVL